MWANNTVHPPNKQFIFHYQHPRAESATGKMGRPLVLTQCTQSCNPPIITSVPNITISIGPQAARPVWGVSQLARCGPNAEACIASLTSKTDVIKPIPVSSIINTRRAESAKQSCDQPIMLPVPEATISNRSEGARPV